MAMMRANNKEFTEWILITCFFLLIRIEITETLSGPDFVSFLKIRADMIGSDRHRILRKRGISFLSSGGSVEDVLNRAVDDDMVAVNITDITGSDSSSDTTSDLTTSTTTVTSAVTSQSTSTVTSTASTTSTSSTKNKKSSVGTKGTKKNSKTLRKRSFAGF